MDERLIPYALRQVPRYTSYPTAPHFSPAVSGELVRDWLAALDVAEPVSLYLHVPFCRTICHYCGCHTKAVRRDAPVAAYAETLRRELALLAAALPGRASLAHIHWGGGTPSILPPDSFERLVAALRTMFAILPDAEHAIELDPRTVTPDLARMLARGGVTRASLGVQDFSPRVQAAIGRPQPFERVREAVDALREAGISALNFDLMYGLPFQSEEDVARSVALAASLAPDRIALFGYAHVPWMKPHQRLIPETALPSVAARHAQAARAAGALARHGYVRVGLDHFARPDDPMARQASDGTLRRNFQGYTTDPSATLLGVGVSSIGRLPQGYVQNAADIGGWRRAVEAGCLPVARGHALSAQDRARGAAIERIMCDLEVDWRATALAHGLPEDALDDARPALEELEAAGIVALEGSVVSVPEAMRGLARLPASAFDLYLAGRVARHSLAV